MPHAPRVVFSFFIRNTKRLKRDSRICMYVGPWRPLQSSCNPIRTGVRRKTSAQQCRNRSQALTCRHIFVCLRVFGQMIASVRVCSYAVMHVCLRASVFVCLFARSVYVCLYVCVCVCVRFFVCVCVCVCLCVRVRRVTTTSVSKSVPFVCFLSMRRPAPVWRGVAGPDEVSLSKLPKRSNLYLFHNLQS